MKITIRKKRKTKPEVSVDIEKIEKLAGYGLSDEAIADVLGVTLLQFSAAKKNYKSLTDALRRGANKADTNVIETLYRKATGYEHEEVELVKFQGKVRSHPITKYYPAELNAVIFWLKNRQYHNWKEKVNEKAELSEEHLQKLTELAVAEMDRLI
jgi:hypothetical protein